MWGWGAYNPWYFVFFRVVFGPSCYLIMRGWEELFLSLGNLITFKFSQYY